MHKFHIECETEGAEAGAKFSHAAGMQSNFRRRGVACVCAHFDDELHVKAFAWIFWSEMCKKERWV